MTNEQNTEERKSKAKQDEHLIRQSRIHNLTCPFSKQEESDIFCTRIDIRCGHREQFSSCMEQEDIAARSKSHKRLRPPGTRLEDLRVLIVDDDPVMRELCTEYLKMMGITAYCHALNATQSKEILEKSKREGMPVHALVTDVLMGPENESGHVLSNFVDERNYPCTVVLMSADRQMLVFSTEHEIITAKLEKPFSFEQLKNALTPCMGESS